ncbi:MAG: hypothetical protein WD851_06920 [Pirellulales bacterium]
MRLPVRNLVCVLALVALGWLAMGSVRSSGQVDAALPIQWEYRVEESHMSLPLLQGCGREGWELVTTSQTAHDTAIIYTFIFKRPR